MTSALHPYQVTERLFHELISVEVWARMFLDQVGYVRKLLERDDLEGFYYTVPEDRVNAPDMAEFRIAKRAAIPKEFRHLVAELDRYHEFQAKWRTHMHRSKVLANEARSELDSDSLPPLSRTTTAIKRSLQRMGASYPEHFAADFRSVAEEWWVPLMRKQRDEIGTWIDELRLLVVPDPRTTLVNPDAVVGVSTTPSVAATVLAPTMVHGSESEVYLPDEDDLCILQACDQLDLLSEKKRKPYEVIVKAALGPGFERVGKDKCIRLVEHGFLAAKRGNRGGHWLPPKGQEWLRSKGVSSSSRAVPQTDQNANVRKGTPDLSPDN